MRFITLAQALFSLATAVIATPLSGPNHGVTDIQSRADAQVEAALSALTVTNIDDVRGNLYLPPTIDNLTVTWSSSQPNIISTSGVVTREATDTTVELTATISGSSRTFTASVRKAATFAAFEGYMFAYFTGDTTAGEKIYFAASAGNDALTWAELNAGQPVLTSTLGTKGLRDPFIIRSPQGDTFYLVATDLSIGSGTSWGDSQRNGSLYLEIWESHDLVNWGAQRHVKVSPPTAGNTWAPEAFWDENSGSYAVFWASPLYEADDTNHSGGAYQRVLLATTRDFVTFSEPTVWEDAGMSRIDSTVVKDGDVYFRFTKDEGAGGTGCSDIIQERSSDLRANLSNWTTVATCIGKKAGTSAVEGPTSFKANKGDVRGEKWYLFVDEYGGRGYIPLETADIAKPNWTVASNYSLPKSPRHGTVMPITAAELATLTGTGIVSEKRSAKRAIPANANGEILRYDFQAMNENSTILPDVSGNGQNGTIFGGATTSDGIITFDGVDDYISLPDKLLSGVTDVTVEIEVLISTSQATPYFLFGLGNTVDGSGDGYLFATGDSAYRFSIATGDYATEQTVSMGSALSREEWLHLAYTLTNGTATLYLNGVQVAQETDVTVVLGDIGEGVTSANYIGRSDYESDKLFAGQVRKFVLYNRALSASEVLSASGNTAALADVTLSDASRLKVPPIVDQDLHTVVFPVIPGTDTTSLAPVFTLASGVTLSPPSGTTVDLSQNVTYTLSLNGTTTTTWTMLAVPMNSPALPGLYADPNIAVFNRTFYIYATTDGYASWGGNVFYVWSSTDLVSWARSETPMLALNGTAGNVPWATGNAWAPTIIERDGKYYFYFSGNNPTYDRKTIGAAVADSPEGPWTAQSEAMILNDEAVTTGQAIDPCAFMDPETGKYYLLWGNGSPLYAELAEDMVSLKNGTLKAVQGTLTDFREGTFVNYRQGMYHMTYSIDDTGSADYRVGYATAESVDGPWTYRGVVLQKNEELGILATGHDSIVQVPGTDDWYMAYHRFAMPVGDGTHRETCIDKVTFDEETGMMREVVPTLEGVVGETVP